MTNKLFCIVKTSDETLFKAKSDKVGWAAPHHAKAAWTRSVQQWDEPKKKFDSQEEYQIVEIDYRLQLALQNNALRGFSVVVTEDDRYRVSRTLPPYLDLYGKTCWFGDTLIEAIDKANEALEVKNVK